MKPGRLFWGIFILSLGILFLLRNITGAPVISADVYRLWPLIFVLFGAAHLISNNNIRSVLYGSAGLLAALSIYTMHIGPFNWNWKHRHEHSYAVGKSFDEAFHPEIKKVYVSLEGGAGEFTIERLDSGQYHITPLDSEMKYVIEKTVDGDAMHLNISNNGENVNLHFGDGWKYGLNVQLNTAPHYEFNFQNGASSNNYDLSGFLIDKLNFEGGASSTVLKLGQPGESETKVDIQGGASSFKLEIPQNVAAKIRTSTALSSTSIQGFEKIGDDLYQTTNYSTADKKFNINCEGGVMSLEVNQY